MRRLCIAYLFKTKYNGAPDTRDTPWNGRKGITQFIKKDLGISRNSKVNDILIDFVKCQEKGEVYQGRGNRGQCGRNPLIELESKEAQIIVNELENNDGSIRSAWKAVNVYREEVKREKLTESAVYGAIARMREAGAIKIIKEDKKVDEVGDQDQSNLIDL